MTTKTNPQEKPGKSIGELCRLIEELPDKTVMNNEQKSELAVSLQNAATQADTMAKEVEESANEFRDNCQNEIDQVFQASKGLSENAARMRQTADKLAPAPTIAAA